MSDQAQLESAPTPPPATAAPVEDKVLPAVVYALYLVGFATGITVILGLILAYVSKDKAGPALRTHYDFQIRTFWMGLAWAVIGALLMVVGVPLSLVLIGIPVVALGGLILALLGVWFAVRCIVGLIHLSRGEPYPRPDTWLV